MRYQGPVFSLNQESTLIEIIRFDETPFGCSCRNENWIHRAALQVHDTAAQKLYYRDGLVRGGVDSMLEAKYVSEPWKLLCCAEITYNSLSINVPSFYPTISGAYE